MPALALEIESEEIQEITTRQQEIDSILTELNEMAAEERMTELLCKDAIASLEKYDAVKEKNSLRKRYLEDKLEKLGINTIDPDNPDDMQALAEVMLGNRETVVENIPDPPDLSTFANCYTLQQFNGSVDVDGTSYQYSCIYVTDNKGYSNGPLTQSQTVNVLIGKESTFLSNILEYNFSFGLSSYLGVFPNGWFADWTIGTVCAVLESFGDRAIISYRGDSNIYNMSMLSVTQMMYTYVYWPDVGWCLCGSKASNISYARAEYVIANVEGTVVSEPISYPEKSSYTGSVGYVYARNYINNGIHVIDSIGSFTVNTYNGAKVRFVPGFAGYPVQLL